MVLVLGCFYIRLRGVKPVAAVDYRSQGDLEVGGAVNVEDYPMVLLQIPMCNEREVSRCRSLGYSTLCFLDQCMNLYICFLGAN